MKGSQRFLFLLFSACVALFATAFVSMSSVLSLLFYLLLFTVVWKVVLRWCELERGLGVFFFYAALALCLYVWQLAVAPEYFGFSGGIGVGTDDSFFYSLAAPDLPGKFRVREGYWLRTHNYADVLKVFSGLFSALHSDLHPLDLIFFNVLGLSFVPFFAKKVALLATNDPRAARFTFWTTLICPFLIANGLILVREGWIAMLYIGAFYFVMTRHYLLLGCMLLGAVFLRFEAGLLLMFSVVLYGSMVGRSYSSEIAGVIQSWRSTPAILIIFSVIFVLSILAGAVIGVDQLGVMAMSRLYRGDFLESFIALSNSADGAGTFYTINQLPWYFSIPLGFVFFLGSPFFSVREITIDENVIPRMLLANLFSIMFIWYFAYFSRAIVRIFKGSNSVVTIFVLIFLIDVLVLSQASMQIRHKVALMPLFYVILGFGYVYRRSTPVLVGLFAGSSVVFVNVLAIAR